MTVYSSWDVCSFYFFFLGQKKTTKKQNTDAATSPSFWTAPTSVYEYEVIIEVNSTDVAHLRNTLQSTAFPASLGAHTNVSYATITTGKNKSFALSVRTLRFQFPFVKYRSFKFADQKEALSSADVRKVTHGHATSASRTGGVTMTQTRVGALEVSPQMGNSASQYTFRVSFTP